MELYIVGDRSTRYQVKRGEDVLVQGLSNVLDGRLRLVIADRDGLFYGDHVELYHETLGKLAELSYVPGEMLDADLRESQARREAAIAEAMRGPRAATVARRIRQRRAGRDGGSLMTRRRGNGTGVMARVGAQDTGHLPAPDNRAGTAPGSNWTRRNIKEQARRSHPAPSPGSSGRSRAAGAVDDGDERRNEWYVADHMGSKS